MSERSDTRSQRFETNITAGLISITFGEYMTFSNGTRWEHDVAPMPEVGATGGHPSAADQLLRLDDGRWTPMPVVAEAEQPIQQPASNRLPYRDEATTQLAVTSNRMPQEPAIWGADPELEAGIDDAWARSGEYDAAFEEASTRFFDTDPGNRLTYAHLLDIDEQPVNSDPTPSYQVPVVKPVGDEYDEFPIDDDELATVAAARRNAIEWAVVLVAAVLLALVLRAVVLQAFFIPSPSMEDTLLVQDRVLVNKLSYQFSDVSRGDIVVFHRTDEEIAAAGPNQPRDVIKRVIGLGGETVEIRNNAVHINGQELVEPYLDPDLVMADFGPVAVPEGTVFVMGDNRNLSSDSRGELGPIDEERIVGRAFVLFWPLNRLGRL